MARIAKVPDGEYTFGSVGTREQHFTISSLLDAPVDDVWARVSTVAGMSAELMPLARMTMPRGQRELTPETMPPGRRSFRSWILALGFLPIDCDNWTIVELEPGRRFLARSTMLSQSFCEHERTLEPTSASTTLITDRLRFRPRLPGARLLRLGIAGTFRHRHARLRRHFGGRPPAMER